MSMNPDVLKKVVIVILVMALLFIGYSFLFTSDDKPTLVETDTTSAGAEYSDKIEFFNYFEHTKPGEYSEIFVEITGLKPNVQKIVYVRFAGTQNYIDAGGQDMVTTKDGHISTRFQITSYGEYEVVTYDKNGDEIVSPVIVVK